MAKKYLPFLALGPVANLLWAFWALKDMDEQGTTLEMLQWICVQALVPLLFALLVRFKKRYVYWMLVIYSGFMILFAFGILGWALMGENTPISVYAVFLTLITMAFGIFYHAMKDLDFDNQEIKRYEIPD